VSQCPVAWHTNLRQRRIANCANYRIRDRQRFRIHTVSGQETVGQRHVLLYRFVHVATVALHIHRQSVANYSYEKVLQDSQRIDS